MNRRLRSLAVPMMLFAASGLAAQSIPNATAAATITAKPGDVSSADAIIAALYDANSVMVDQKRAADRVRSLFVPGARLMPTSRAANGKAVISIQTVDDYVRVASSGQPRHGFSEREIARTSETFGNIMQVFSTYEARRDSTDTQPTRGINSIQLFNDGARWWVVGVLWDNERPDKPIPASYLKPTRPSEPPTAVTIQFVRFADIFGGRLVAAFDSIPAAKYEYRPTTSQQTVGYIAQHLENANYSLCERLGDAKHPRTAKDSLADTVKARWPKDTLVARLDASLGFCGEVLERLGRLDSPAVVSTLLAFETDLAEHYSQIAVYMRLLGLVPPSALPPKPRTAIALPSATLSPYVGVYEIAPGLDLVVTMQNDALSIQSTPGGTVVRLWPESAVDFFVKDVDAQVIFTRDARGNVTGLLFRQFGRTRPATKIR